MSKEKEIIDVNPEIFKKLLPGKTYLEAERLIKKFGYQIRTSMNNGVTRPNTHKSEFGCVYVEIRKNQIYKVIRYVRRKAR